MEKEKERWVVLMPCKSYVKRWLLSNFNKPDENWPEIVNFGPDKVLQKSFYNHLKRNYTPRGQQWDVSSRYNENVAIEFTKTAFDRYGWELTDRELIEFNNELEARVRLLLRSYALGMRSMGVRVSYIIKGFRQMTGITEFEWADDSIRKDILRHVSSRIDANFGEILLKVGKKVCAHLSNLGQLTNKGAAEFTSRMEEGLEDMNHSNIFEI